MLRTIDLRGRTFTAAELLAAVPRATAAREEALATAATLVADVARDGETALRAQAERFDHVSGHEIRVPAAHLDEALSGLDPGCVPRWRRRSHGSGAAPRHKCLRRP